MKIYLIDANPKLAREWSEKFSDIADVFPAWGKYFSYEAEAMVSPANCLGYMDGGIDKEIVKNIPGIQQKVFDCVRGDKWNGEIPVGCADIVETGHAKWKNLIIAPTMRIPESVNGTVNAYFAFRAALLIARQNKINSMVCCGLASGIGGIKEELVALQMKEAYLNVFQNKKFFDQPLKILALHRKMAGTES